MCRAGASILPALPDACQGHDSSAPIGGHDVDLIAGILTGYTRAAGGYQSFSSAKQLLFSGECHLEDYSMIIK